MPNTIKAYCRACVHERIPTAEAWRAAVASARALQTPPRTLLASPPGPAVRLVPVFVVGMPRSGSTLLEQMLAQV